MTDPVPPRARSPDPPPPARRLLVIACSARKRKDAGLLPAVDRYDGPAFRVLRKFLADAADPPDVLVLSARYGLIPSSRGVPDYDRRLTPGDADALRPGVLLALGDALARTRYTGAAFCRRMGGCDDRHDFRHGSLDLVPRDLAAGEPPAR